MMWWRAHHGLPFDPKLAVIAKRCELPRGNVAAVWTATLDYASQSEDRGSVDGIDAEEIAVSFDYEVEDVSKVLAAFKEKGLIANGRLAAWERRQVNRERDDDSVERVRAYRQRKRDGSQETPTSRHETPVTPCNAPDKNRVDKNRAEIQNAPNNGAPAIDRRSEASARKSRSVRVFPVWFDAFFADEFWPDYWRRDAKTAGKAALFKHCQDIEAACRIHRAMLAQKEFYERRETEKRPHLSTWSNQARFDDGPLVAESGTANGTGKQTAQGAANRIFGERMLDEYGQRKQLVP